MRCFSCHKISIDPICKECMYDMLGLDTNIEKIGNLDVVSFFNYYLIVDFIKSKYSHIGYRVYKFFAKQYFNPFLKHYVENLDDDSNKKIYLIGVNDNNEKDYSVVSILMRNAARGNSKIKPLYNALKAKNRVKYAGKSLNYRLNNPRKFIYNGPKNIDAILIDDTITTGTTLEEAYRVLKDNNVNVHFALTVAVAKEGIDY